MNKIYLIMEWGCFMGSSDLLEAWATRRLAEKRLEELNKTDKDFYEIVEININERS